MPLADERLRSLGPEVGAQVTPDVTREVMPEVAHEVMREAVPEVVMLRRGRGEPLVAGGARAEREPAAD